MQKEYIMRKFVLAGLTAVLFSPVLLFSGEVVHMKFDGNLEDSAGGRQGRSIGTPVSYIADRFGNPDSAVLLKKGDRISLGNDKGLSFVKDGKAQPFTVEWLQCYDAGGAGKQVILIQKNGEYRIAWNNAFRFRADDRAKSASLSRNNGKVSLKRGQWTHIAVVFENAGTDGIRFYQDGKQIPAVADAGEKGKYQSMNPGKGPLMIGINFEGALDDLVIHDRALSAGEIRQHATAQP